MDRLQIDLNPNNLSEYIGNDRVKEILQITIDACKKNNLLLSHTLITGPRGTGKTTLATLVAKELGMSYKILGANALTTVSDLNNLFVFNLPSVLILDEIHNLRHYFSDLMHSAMDNFEYTYVDEDNNIIRVQTEPFALIGITTDEGKLTAPLYSRFQKKIDLEPYTIRNLQTIVFNACHKNNINILTDAAWEIAVRSNGIPRIALLNMVNCYEYAMKYNNSVIDVQTACDALELHGIDKKGLNPKQREILKVLSYSDRPMGAENISQRVGIGVEALIYIYEPFLIMSGFVERRSAGRVITTMGKAYILREKI